MDFINLMSYDLHGSWDATTGFNSPLFPRSTEIWAQRYLNIVSIYFRLNLMVLISILKFISFTE